MTPLVTEATVRLEVQRLHPLAVLPVRARSTDAGYDIASIEQVLLPPISRPSWWRRWWRRWWGLQPESGVGARAVIVRTGIRISAPPGYYYTIDGRSSLWRCGVMPHRGIIDATYCGEVVVSLVNYTDQPYRIEVGQRIAQIVLHRQYHAIFEEVDAFSPLYNQRGENGFGSTGK